MNVLEDFVAPIVVILVAAWLLGLLNWILPTSDRARLALRNLWSKQLQRPEDSFRIVLSWLKNDRSGNDTENVALAFSGVDGIDLVRSARIVATASEAGEDWREEMQQRARVVFKDWNADLAVVGLVKKSGEVLSLWFVPRSGEGTLGRGDQPYKLEDVTLGEDFQADLRAQLTTVALATVNPLTNDEVRGQILENGLRDATARLSNLLNGGTIDNAKHRADLHVAFGGALFALGERESGTERLEDSVEAYREALKEHTRERMPRDWAMTKNNLGAALSTLGERENSIERLKDAVEACREALEVYTRKCAPLYWAATKNNLGIALRALGERESDTGRLEDALEACREALKERTSEREPLDWAMTQINRGNALSALGERESGTERLEGAVEAYREALKIFSAEGMPQRYRGIAQNNLDRVLGVILERELLTVANSGMN